MVGTICGDDGDGADGGADSGDSVFGCDGRTRSAVLWRSGSVCEGVG